MPLDQETSSALHQWLVSRRHHRFSASPSPSSTISDSNLSPSKLSVSGEKSVANGNKVVDDTQSKGGDEKVSKEGKGSRESKGGKGSKEGKESKGNKEGKEDKGKETADKFWPYAFMVAIGVGCVWKVHENYKLSEHVTKEQEEKIRNETILIVVASVAAIWYIHRSFC